MNSIRPPMVCKKISSHFDNVIDMHPAFPPLLTPRVLEQSGRRQRRFSRPNEVNVTLKAAGDYILISFMNYVECALSD